MTSKPLVPLIQAAAIAPAGRRRVATVLAQASDAAAGAPVAMTMAQIAAAAGLSKVQARKHVHALTQDGVLRVLANAHGGVPGEAPQYEFDRQRLAQCLASVPDLFQEAPQISGPTHRFTSEGRSCMVAELAGRPGKRRVRFYREAKDGLHDYGSVPLHQLLWPWRLQGGWDATVYPVVENEDDYPEEIYPGEFEKLQQWAQAAALGRVESVVEA
ncbi:hypothetical protein [Paenacidovorax caeni]|nr:hypothetical protein [Paenacidovorax caeni]